MTSVIIPVYNTQKYLKQCVDSVLQQSYSDLEIILVNDGSTDDSGSICDSYAAQDSRITVIHKINGGLSDARNHGVNIAKGEYIIFVDSDDYIDGDAIAILNSHAKQTNSDMVIFDYCRFCDDNNAIDNNKDKKLASGKYNKNEALNLFRFNNLSLVTACFKYCRTEVVKCVPFPIGRICEDEFVAHRIIEKCNVITVLPDILYHYRDNPKSITNNNNYYRNPDRLFAFEDRVIMLNEHGLYDASFVQSKNFFLFFCGIYPKLYNANRNASLEVYFSMRKLYKNLMSNPLLSKLDKLKLFAVKNMPSPYCIIYNLIYRD